MSDSTTSLKTILAPIDFSDFSNNALDVATDLASRLGAELILVNVVPAIPDLPSSVSIFKEGEYDQSLHDATAKRLSDLAASLSAKNIKSPHGDRHRQRRGHGNRANRGQRTRRYDRHRHPRHDRLAQNSFRLRRQESRRRSGVSCSRPARAGNRPRQPKLQLATSSSSAVA